MSRSYPAAEVDAHSQDPFPGCGHQQLLFIPNALVNVLRGKNLPGVRGQKVQNTVFDDSFSVCFEKVRHRNGRVVHCIEARSLCRRRNSRLTR